MQIGVLGSGSWATALARILTQKGETVNWWVRNDKSIEFIKLNGHNPHYLSSVLFDADLLYMSSQVEEIIEKSDCIIIAIPSSYLHVSIGHLREENWKGKKIVSAIKGIIPDYNVLLNQYLSAQFNFPLQDYFALLGPCHAEEVAAEKLSYLTISGADVTMASQIASQLANSFITTIINDDIIGVQYAAVLKNIYAIGAGISHGLDYGDNFLSVYTANVANEMATFLKKSGAQNIVVGAEETSNLTHRQPNYAASVYLGDLLVTCYSLHSRNRSFGNMVGRGYSIKTILQDMNMVAEGYNASKCMYTLNTQLNYSMPIADLIYKTLWEGMSAKKAFLLVEKVLV